MAFSERLTLLADVLQLNVQYLGHRARGKGEFEVPGTKLKLPIHLIDTQYSKSRDIAYGAVHVKGQLYMLVTSHPSYKVKLYLINSAKLDKVPGHRAGDAFPADTLTDVYSLWEKGIVAEFNHSGKADAGWKKAC